MTVSAYDVVIVGGGIHGAGVAQAAAAEGHSVLVLEQTGLASGTSSRSSKLIHGGLRYLESGQYALVRECLQERALLLKRAPDLVRLQPFHIPVYLDTRRRAWQLRVGLSLYALLAFGGPGARFNTLARRDWGRLDGLDTAGLRAVFRYWDAQTDDAALTRAVMHSAQSLGAELRLPARFLRATHNGQRLQVEYEDAAGPQQCEAKAVVNAAGPWANAVLRQVTPAIPGICVELVQGTHILVDMAVAAGMYYLEAPRDRRAVFVMPWHGKALVGTTETVYRGEPSAVKPLPEEITYLQEILAHYFPRQPVPAILDSYAGLRVLPAGTGRAFTRTRETLLHMDGGVLTIYGGKLTAYRATAEKVMARLADRLPRRERVADTRVLPLSPV